MYGVAQLAAGSLAAAFVTVATQTVPAHGVATLPAVRVLAYNAELQNEEGFLGDRANRRAFQAILDDWRDQLRQTGDDPKPKRDEAVQRLATMLRTLIRWAEREGRMLAPLIGIGCPSIVGEDGSIERGGQNLPGNWASSRFHLPSQIRELMPEIGGHPVAVLLHNDAVVQGLSELPWMQDVESWGVLTIGTGLGNASFSNSAREPSSRA